MQNQNITCDYCGTNAARGIKVCPGPNCGANILYKATDAELRESFHRTFAITLLSSLLALLVFPFLLNSQFGFNVPLMFGLSFYGVILALALSVWLGFRSRAATEAVYAGRVRFMR